jgi:alpha-1,2-mannosyltransferase
VKVNQSLHPEILPGSANRLAPDRNREVMDDELLAESEIGVDVKRASEMPGVSARRILLVLLVAVPLVFLAYGLVAWLRGWSLGVDSSVYRAGAVLFLHGHSLYDVNDLGYLHLSFTYPPAAALLFTPLAALPAQLAGAVMASASVLALALVIRIAVAAVPYWRFPAAWSTLLLTMAMLCLVPVWRTIGLGQVNMRHC